MPKDQQIDIIDEIYDLRPAQPTIDDWHIRKVSGKVPQPDTGASDEYYTPGRRRHLAILLFECRHRVRPLLVGVLTALVSIMAAPYPARRAMTAQEPAMAKVNQMMPRSGQPNRFSFHIEIKAKTTQVTPRNTISPRLKAIIVR